MNFGFLTDPLSVTWLLLVTGVGTLIHLYSIGYMHGDPRFSRFFCYLNLFAASMLMLVLGRQLPRHLPRLGGRRALLVPARLVLVRAQRGRGGGQEGVRHEPRRRRRVPARDVPDLRLVRDARLRRDDAGRPGASRRAPPPRSGCCSCSRRVGKSAQIPLHVWLPDAMEGPTPVSALIHAATMVTAGVFLLCRAFPFFEASGDASTVVAWVGGITALLAGTVAIVQPDIKRVLAYSTVSQLGYMFLAVGVQRVQRRGVHGDLPRLLQGLPLPRRRLGDPRQPRQPGHAASWAGSGGSCPTPRSGWWSRGSRSPASRRSSGFFSKDEIITEVFLAHDYGLWVVALGRGDLHRRST